MARKRSFSSSLLDRVPDPVRRAATFHVRSPLQVLQDRRLFHPAGVLASPRSFYRRIRVVAVPRNKREVSRFDVPSALGFAVPFHVGICIRRKTREEVLHAKRFTGRGSGGGRKRRNRWSIVRC